MLQQRFDVVLCSVTGSGALSGGDVMVVMMMSRPLFASEKQHYFRTNYFSQGAGAASIKCFLIARTQL